MCAVERVAATKDKELILRNSRRICGVTLIVFILTHFVSMVLVLIYNEVQYDSARLFGYSLNSLISGGLFLFNTLRLKRRLNSKVKAMQWQVGNRPHRRSCLDSKASKGFEVEVAKVSMVASLKSRSKTPERSKKVDQKTKQDEASTVSPLVEEKSTTLTISRTPSRKVSPGKDLVISSMIDTKTMDSKTIDSKTIDSKTIDSKTTDTKTVDTKLLELKADSKDRKLGTRSGSIVSHQSHSPPQSTPQKQRSDQSHSPVRKRSDRSQSPSQSRPDIKKFGMVRVQTRLNYLLGIGLPILVFVAVAPAFGGVSALQAGSKSFSESIEQGRSSFSLSDEVVWWSTILATAFFVLYGWSPIRGGCGIFQQKVRHMFTLRTRMDTRMDSLKLSRLSLRINSVPGSPRSRRGSPRASRIHPLSPSGLAQAGNGSRPLRSHSLNSLRGSSGLLQLSGAQVAPLPSPRKTSMVMTTSTHPLASGGSSRNGSLKIVLRSGGPGRSTRQASNSPKKSRQLSVP
mmetsp:Transcript_6579/g.10141  ORF Transcript_6579/g.10141 Transcript_6579/m.10141 type:complete len:514 (-) Transcript_6579:243-1784(-)